MRVDGFVRFDGLMGLWDFFEKNNPTPDEDAELCGYAGDGAFHSFFTNWLAWGEGVCGSWVDDTWADIVSYRMDV